MFHINPPLAGLDYLPQKWSPLGLRDLNVSSVMMTSNANSATYKPRPLQRCPQQQAVDLQREKRNKYLQKVRQTGEDQKWKIRSDQVALRLMRS